MRSPTRFLGFTFEFLAATGQPFPAHIVLFEKNGTGRNRNSHPDEKRQARVAPELTSALKKPSNVRKVRHRVAKDKMIRRL
ncbi:MAG: hypothetical protein ACE10G_14235 [Gemmatimonadales bacterium]